jgi:hypothetical protein
MYRHMAEPVGKAWQAVLVSPALRDRTWFVEHAPSGGLSIGDSFFKLWKEPEDRSWLSYAIGLHVDANRMPHPDIQLAKGQIALELLTWVIATEKEMLVSTRGFEASSAADKIRLALLWAGLRADVPQRFEHLRRALDALKRTGRFGSDGSPFDGPFAITQLRNCIVHSTRAKRKVLETLSDNALHEVWLLSQEYTALLLLRLLHYNGPYRDRMGHIYSTPWSAVL